MIINAAPGWAKRRSPRWANCACLAVAAANAMKRPPIHITMPTKWNTSTQLTALPKLAMDFLPNSCRAQARNLFQQTPVRNHLQARGPGLGLGCGVGDRSEEHTSELQSLAYLVCRLLLEKK